MQFNVIENISKKTRLFIIPAFISFILFSIYAGTHFFQEPMETIDKPDVSIPEPTILKPEEPVLKIQRTVKRGDTIIEILKNVGVSHNQAYSFFMQTKPVYDLRRIAAGKKYKLFLSTGKDQIKRFTYQIDLNQYLDVFKEKKEENFNARLVTIPYKEKKETIRGTITESLFASILKSGEKAELADLMASLYEYDIDFNRDLRKGDSFALIVEKNYLDDKFIKYGNILAAEFTNKGNTTKLVRYTDPDGKTAYYHPDGRSVRKMFLRCPLPFMRVTSRYGNRRHPVLGFSARHNGTDFAAPIGTKVRATAFGVVIQAGYHRGKGKHIAIRHNNRYVSKYYHLNGFRKGIKRGVRVQQGQVIGYVGKTGLVTGPHLHYGLQKNGRFINPLSLKSPTKEPVKKKFLQAFARHTQRSLLLLAAPQPVPFPEKITEKVITIPFISTPIHPAQ